MIGYTIFFFIGTIFLYLAMIRLYDQYRHPLLIPFMTTSVSLMAFLIMTGISHETYMLGGQWIDRFLGPAIVALAIPLHNQRHTIRRYWQPILGGVMVGVFTGFMTGLLLTKWAGFSEELILSMLPKSITTPIAIQIAQSVGGIPEITVAFVIIAGFLGVVIGEPFFKLFKIDSPTGRGIGLGVASHALGTSKAVELGEQEASMSSLAMTLCAVIGSIIGPFIVLLFM